MLPYRLLWYFAVPIGCGWKRCVCHVLNINLFLSTLNRKVTIAEKITEKSSKLWTTTINIDSYVLSSCNNQPLLVTVIAIPHFIPGLWRLLDTVRPELSFCNNFLSNRCWNGKFVSALARSGCGCSAPVLQYSPLSQYSSTLHGPTIISLGLASWRSHSPTAKTLIIVYWLFTDNCCYVHHGI